MEEQKVNIHLENGVKTLEILTGNALAPKPPKTIAISGQIDSIVRFLEQRKDEVNHETCHVQADKDKGVIKLFIDEKDPYGGIIEGSIEFSEKIKIWKLQNAESEFSSPQELALFIRKRMHHFDSKSEAMKLVSELLNFKAKVDRTVEAKDDLRGNRKALLEQAVESNLPAVFSIHIPIFKGDEPQRIELEVLINADNFACTLFSPNLPELIENGFKDKVDEQLGKIKDLHEELVIIEV